MDIDIKIGKEVEGNSILLVPQTFKKVSRRHATLHWHDGTAVIEDNESTNGTFVNGRRIAKTKITENDTLWLGGVDDEKCYQVDLKKVFESCRQAEEKQRTDYSKEFEDLKKAYMDYQAEVVELKKKANQKSQLPKLLASLVPAIVGLGFVIFSKDPTLRIVSMSVGSVLSGVIGILTMGKSNNNAEKMNEDITEIQIKYQKLYKCPKCSAKIPLTTHWKKLEAEGTCPNPKCNVEFVKK